jgi:tetratricopeptide (TPR) repeat protein
MPEMRVSLFEEHSSVLPEWWRRQVRGRTVVYLDAHLDLQYVNQERLETLEQCTTVDAFTGLEKPHHLFPDRDYSYGIEDFLYPAHRLGLIDHVIWVAPPHVETGYSQAAFDQLQQLPGVQFDELASFKRVGGGWIEGQLLGLNITICNYLQLEKLPLPANSLIDIDTDFFVAVPGDIAWVNPRSVFEVLNRLPLQPEFVTLSRSVNSGFMPLRYRFFADHLVALWKNRHEDAAHYERLFHWDQQLHQGENEVVVSACQRELLDYPECAASFYLLSLAERDSNQAKQHQRQAAILSSSYSPNLLRSICEFQSRQLAGRFSTILALEKQLSTVVQMDPRERALAQVALGLIYCACGEIDRAVTHYEQSVQHLGYHPELALEISKRLLKSQPEQAIPLLEVALQDDKTRAAANVLLAQVYGKRGSLGQALQYLEKARAMAPAWGQLLPMLADIHGQLGNQHQSQTLLKEHRERQLRTELLARRLTSES